MAVGVAAVPLATQAAATPLPLLVARAGDGIDPEQAADQRLPVQAQGREMVAQGELTAATIFYDSAAERQGDPVLFLDAADAYLQVAEQERDIAAAETAKLRSLVAQDILYFHRDPAAYSDIQLVTEAEVGGLISRGEQIVAKADALIAEIQAEQEALANPQPAPTTKTRNGNTMRLAGFGLLGVGLAGLGVGVAGLVIGRVNQKRVEDPAVYGDEFDQFDAKGRRGNVIAGVGLAVGGVALAAGITLVMLGKRAKAKSGGSSGGDAAPDEGAPPPPPPTVRLVPTGRGLALVGRF